ncbi:hypothetical protein [Bacillus atrophaeus]|uniref:hypothetical protein n=1 Tax=Bacillus atrophaeus TaxID=1452 RepID=UPI002281B609|nr:hypothetical protein [Bacillus atrophaeus]MCY7866039.1 hypothetical protein [Bacillus spizizenii]MCY8890399.1 hypothetical protein [Bacillus spizizenii]MEC0841854.1 hypothetical protein [Bacillus spizizenii]MED1125254.1 hypothetical protein [Bacillus atrophaeus]
MNLVDKHRKLSTANEMCKNHSFSVQPFPGKKGVYCIEYVDGRRRAYLDNQFVSFVMRKALQYKTDHQDRLVFKVKYQIVQYDLSAVIIFDSETKARRALNNFMLFVKRKHGNLAGAVMQGAKRHVAPF